MAKPRAHNARVELYPSEDAMRDYSPSAVQLLPQTGTSVDRDVVLDRGHQGGDLSCLKTVLERQTIPYFFFKDGMFDL